MQSLFLDSGIQYISFRLPDDVKRTIDGLPPDERIGLLGRWSQESPRGMEWMRWRITRREETDDAKEAYELILAVDTSSGPPGQGFVAESERHIQNSSFNYKVEFTGGSISLRPAREGEQDFPVSFEFISSGYGGEVIPVALVLDVGNSRTLGLLVDEVSRSGDNNLSLTDNVSPFLLTGKEDPAREESVFSTNLELALSPVAPDAYPSSPLFTQPQPVASPVERHLPAQTGGWKERLKALGRRPGTPAPAIPRMQSQVGRDESGKHPRPFDREVSFVRLGEEAEILQERATDLSQDQNVHSFATGMTSPKRYLWDDERTHSAWFMHGRGERARGGAAGDWCRSLSGQRILRHFTDEDTDWPTGEDLGALQKAKASGMSLSALSRVSGIEERSLQYWIRALDYETGDRMDRLISQAGKTTIMPPQWPSMAQPSMSPPSARYPRRAAMVWLLLDLFIRAWEQMNSPRFRDRSIKPNQRRRLKDIVITFPACMPPEEHARYHQQAEKALGILMREILPAEDRKRPPELHWDWDEARAAQLVFLYASTQGADLDGRRFIEMFGRPGEAGEAEVRRLRVASLDIGGGTTDLAIVDYESRGTTGTELHPHLVFQDGLRVGGDNILYEIVRGYVFPRVAKNSGVSAAQLAAIVNGVDPGGSGAPWTKSPQEATYWRRRWMRSIWVPLATRVIELLVAAGEQGGGRTSFRCGNVCRDARALEKLSKAASKAGLPFKVGADKCEISLDLEELTRLMEEAFKADIRSLCGETTAYHPDFVLVSGRITAVPAIRDLVMRFLSVSQKRVVFLHGYPVGNWYPRVFQDREGRIKDAKSVVAVGATIGLLAGSGKMSGFVVNDHSTEADPGYFWGASTHQVAIIPQNACLFRPEHQDGETANAQVAGSRFLLLRKRDGADNAPAEPVYELFHNSRLSDARVLSPRYTFQLNRDNRFRMKRPLLIGVGGDVALRGEQKRALVPDDVTCRFMTLDQDGYFLDSGEIHLKGGHL